MRIYLWDNIKVVLMLFVILTHSICVYQQNDTMWVQYYWVLIMTYTMPLFTITSGFWFKKKNIRNVCMRFLWPFIVFSIIIFAWGGVFYEPYKNATIGTYLRLAYAMWYLWALFIYYLITPVLLKHFRTTTIFYTSLLIALSIGFLPFIGTLLQLSRVICFYPFFILGILLKERNEWLHKLKNRSKVCMLVLIMLSIFYMYINFLHPGIVYGTGFMSGFGFSIKGLMVRIFTYFMCIAMSISFIGFMPNKKIWFTKFGTRTMNAYLCHMLIIFPCTWGIGPHIIDKWYGYVFLIVIVPLLCIPLYSNILNRIMNKILLIKK